MKKSLLIIACLSLVTSAVFALSGSQTYSSSASSPQLIGQFCLSEAVQVTTPVIIPSSRVAFVESTGRTVYSKRADDPYFPMPNSIEHIDYNSYYYNPLVYYYFAMPNGYERITEIFNLYNDIDSLIKMVEYLESKAFGFSASYGPVDRLNLVIGYVRSINSDYVGDYISSILWNNICGSIDTSFINYVDTDDTHGLRVAEFFASFIFYSKYNVDIHGDIDSNFQKNSNNIPLEFIDPFNSTKSIDLIHLFAALDGVFDDSINAHFNMLDFYAERDLVSWAGDIQQALNYFFENNESIYEIGYYDYTSFTQVMNIAPAGATDQDILGDIDAYNIAKNFIDLGQTDISNILYYYYHQSSFNRYESFIHACADDINNDTWTDLQKFSYKVYHMCGLQLQSNGDYWNVCNIVQPVYWLMMVDTSFPPYDMLEQMANLFYSYIVLMSQ